MTQRHILTKSDLSLRARAPIITKTIEEKQDRQTYNDTYTEKVTDRRIDGTEIRKTQIIITLLCQFRPQFRSHTS